MNTVLSICSTLASQGRICGLPQTKKKIKSKILLVPGVGRGEGDLFDGVSSPWRDCSGDADLRRLYLILSIPVKADTHIMTVVAADKAIVCGM